MVIQNNVSLKSFNTFGIEAKANKFCSIKTLKDLKKTISDHQDTDFFILGGGSNMLLTRDIDAIVLHIDLTGIATIQETETDITLRVNAGENWHSFVLWCIDKDYGGIENLSLIPGNVGSAPIQNIGAYGVELKDVFVSCEAMKISDQSLTTFSKSDCKFGYRESIFKQELKGQYIITSVDLKLTKKNHKIKSDYGAIKEQLASFNVNHPSIQDISKAVIAIRQSKLPDPEKIGNSGSFFKNPVISTSKFQKLKALFPNIPHYIISESEVKIPAGWLIETAGFKGKRFGNYGVHEKQALVLVNYGNANGKDIYALAVLIKTTVKRLFEIDIEMEVNVI